MKEELYNLCSWVMERATKKGATDCKVVLSKTRFVEINYLDRKPEIIKEATTQNLSVDLFINQKYSNQATPDLRKTTLETFLDNAIANTRYMEDDPYRTLPDASYYATNWDKNLNLNDPGHESFSPEQRHQVAQEIESACLEKGGKKVVSVEAGCYDNNHEEYILNSKGFSAHSETTEYWAGASMTAQDKGDRRPTGYHWVGSRMKDDLPNMSEVGQQAAENTLKLLGSKKIKTEKLPIIIENRNVGRVLSGLIEAMNGRNIQQQRSFLLDKKGEKIGSSILSLYDDPFIMKGMGSRLYDDDGLPTKKMEPMTKGILNNYYVDWYYSRKLGVEPTTSYPSNLSMATGNKSVAQIMKDINRGILISGFIGGNSNTATGDFSVGIIGHLFEKGQPIQAIAEMNIADNHLEFWKKLVATANDPWPWGSWNLPSLVFEDVVVSGV